MKHFVYILIFFLNFTGIINVPAQVLPNFKWGNGSYFNLDIGESIIYQDTEVKLLQLKNHFNKFKIGKDTVWLKVSRRTLPLVKSGLRIFVADNKNVKALAENSNIHSLLQKDVLICLSSFKEFLLDPNKYLFPISFNDGFLWSVEEDSHMFSYESKSEGCRVHGGIDIDMHDARGKEKHLVIAMENSKVVWVKENTSKKETCVLLESDSQPGIYYVYSHLNHRKVSVKEGDKLVRGEPIGNIWGDEIWGHLHIAVVKSDSVPDYNSKYFNAINFFPQIYELYFKQTFGFKKSFTKGIISFGQRSDLHGNQKNISSFEEYSGKGWKLGRWNTADKVASSAQGEEANAQLWKSLFSQREIYFTNPNNWFDYEINVHNGIYRIRAKIGDYNLASWQKVLFEGVPVEEYSLPSGRLKWTSERVVEVKDGKLTVRIFVDETNKKPAGISEIVFQKAY